MINMYVYSTVKKTDIDNLMKTYELLVD